MKEFSTLFQEILEENQIAVYNLAKLVDVDRSLLQKARRGIRTLNYEAFSKVYHYFKTILEPERQHTFYEVFAKDHFGEKEYSALRFIMERLQMIHRNEAYVRDEREKEAYDEKDESAIGRTLVRRYVEEQDLGEKKRALVEMIQELICQADAAAKQGRKPYIYCYLPTAWEHVRSALVLQASETQELAQIDFVYCCAGNPAKIDRDLLLLDNFLAACEMAQYGIKTYGVMNNKEMYSYDLVPYYIMTDEKLVFIFANGEFEICTNKETIKRIKIEYEKIIKTDEAFLTTDRVKMNVLQECSDHILFAPVGTFEQSEEWKKCKRLFIGTDALFGGLYKKNNQVDVQWEDMASVQKQRDYLNAVHRQYSQEGYELVLINTQDYSLKIPMEFQFAADHFMTCSGKESSEGVMREGIAVTNSTVLMKHFQNFFEYLKYMDGCKYGAEALECVKEAVLRLEENDR